MPDPCPDSKLFEKNQVPARARYETLVLQANPHPMQQPAS